MKLTNYFTDFLKDTVNLNQSRIDTLEQRVDTITKFLKESDYDPKLRRFPPQGSWAHRTIIKPPGGKDFDADLLVIMDEVDGWSPKDYVNELWKIFRSNGSYKNIVKRNTRCVTLDYAGDFHLDVVPVLREDGHNGERFYACNRITDKPEETAPEKYTEWLAERNRITGSNNLRKVTRLVKYLRDIKQTFSVKSVLLTTLIGSEVKDLDEQLDFGRFDDVSTSLKTIMSRLDDYLQARSTMPKISNPVLPDEDFNRHWDQATYDNCRTQIHKYRKWIDDAFAEKDKDESIKKWRKVFGDSFAKKYVCKEAASFLPGPRAATALVDATTHEFSNQWLALIQAKGATVLQQFPANLTHVEAPRWITRRHLSLEVKAGQSRGERGQVERHFQSGEILQANRWIRFSAHTPVGTTLIGNVWWQVVNTGGVAADCGQLRGRFEKSNSYAVRWEQTMHRGVHWVQAFFVGVSSGQCLGISAPFFVVIE